MLTRQQGRLHEELDDVIRGQATPSFNTSDITWHSSNPLFSAGGGSVQSRTPIPHSGVARRLKFGVTPVRAVPTGVGESAELAAVLWDSTDMYRHELSEWGGEKGAAYHRW